jgi:hypothetical protein
MAGGAQRAHNLSRSNILRIGIGEDGHLSPL